MNSMVVTFGKLRKMLCPGEMYAIEIIILYNSTLLSFVVFFSMSLVLDIVLAQIK